jgi:hypothetical protein
MQVSSDRREEMIDSRFAQHYPTDGIPIQKWVDAMQSRELAKLDSMDLKKMHRDRDPIWRMLFEPYEVVDDNGTTFCDLMMRQVIAILEKRYGAQYLYKSRLVTRIFRLLSSSPSNKDAPHVPRNANAKTFFLFFV